MPTFRKTEHLHAYVSEGKFSHWTTASCDMTSCGGYVYTGLQQEVVFDIPDTFDWRIGAAEDLRRQIDKVRADKENEISNLTAQLNNLMALEMAVPSGEEVDDIPF